MRACTHGACQASRFVNHMDDTPIVRASKQCVERQALIDEIRNTIDLTTAIHNEELENAAMEHPKGEEIYADRLHEARGRRALLIEKLGRHVAEHGCGRQ